MYKGKTVAAIVAAAGHGSRFGGRLPKQFYRFADGKTVLETTVLQLLKSGVVDMLAVALSEDFLEETEAALRALLAAEGYGELPFIALCGGETRQDSVAAGLRGLAACKKYDLVLIHDSARPFVKPELVRASVVEAERSGACVLAVPVKDTIRQNNMTLNRDGLYAVQTPQTFRREVIEEAYERAYSDGFYGTDDASLVERTGKPVALVPGDYANVKITTREDLKEPRNIALRVGQGFDAHSFAEGRRLVLCGVEIPHARGLLGHSDADVATHALMDALLGAAGLGDIGKYFPDSDESYRDADSLKLLENTIEILRSAGYARLGNADITIIAEAPRISPYIEAMRGRLAEALGEDAEKINVKATTTEKMGFCGREEGIACIAACTIYCAESGGKE